MRLFLLVLGFSLVLACSASAKDVRALVVVGSDGRSITITAEPEVLGVLLYHPASVYNARPKPTRALGAYAKVYPLGRLGFPVIPARFYPATRAICASWDQMRVSKLCGRLGPPPKLLAASRRLKLFVGRPTLLTKLTPPGTPNLITALQLAFDRYHWSRPSRKPRTCLNFAASRGGPQAGGRPTHVCVSHRGIYASGRLYSAGPAVWLLARDSHP